MPHENVIDESPPREATLALRAGRKCPAAGRPAAEEKLRLRLF